MKDDTPDYSRYTLDDLHDVARRVNKQLYPDRYALIVEELERRQPLPMKERKPIEFSGCRPLGYFPLYLRFLGGGGLVYYAMTSFGALFFPNSPVTFLVAFCLALSAGIYSASFLKRESALSRGDFVTLFLTATIHFCGGALLTWAVSVGVFVFLLPLSGDIVVDIGTVFGRISGLNFSAGLGGLVTLGFWLRGWAQVRCSR